MKTIGILESCFKEKFGTPRQPQLVPGATARLHIKKEFIPEQSLKGLSEFSHVWLLSFFHLNTNKAFKSTVHPPRLRGKTVGVFATRSPHHPNSIGLSLARLVKVEGHTLHLAGIDLVEGTPILDIKPYIPAYDAAEDAATGWTERVETALFDVVFSADAGVEAERLKIRTLVEDILRHDTRNPRDKSQLREGKDLAFLLFDRDIHFEVRGRIARVTKIEPASG